jgi:murein DD-endopeptidase MepM/ murein hydrolase activator NlpD
MQKNRNYTIIVVPDARANYKKFGLSRKKIKIIIGIAASFLLVFVGLICANIYFVKKTYELKNSITTNQKLQDENEAYKKAILDLDKKIEDFSFLAKKLKLMAGITQSSDAFMETPGLGGVRETETNTVDNISTLNEVNGLYQGAKELDSNFKILEQSFQKQYLLLASTPSIAPVKGFISSGFGVRKNPFTTAADFHMGIDITAPLGQPVAASAAGTIIFTGYKTGIGNMIMIDHGYGIHTHYGHLSKIIVNVGQQVKRWDIVGLVGNTGKSSGPHLHYEIVRNDNPLNPLDYMLDFEYIQ